MASNNYHLKFTVINKEWGGHPHNNSKSITMDTTSQVDFKNRPREAETLEKLRSMDKLEKPLAVKTTEYKYDFVPQTGYFLGPSHKNLENDTKSYFI